jgi:peptidoglycan-associated lipoprotein
MSHHSLERRVFLPFLKSCAVAAGAVLIVGCASKVPLNEPDGAAQPGASAASSGSSGGQAGAAGSTGAAAQGGASSTSGGQGRPAGAVAQPGAGGAAAGQGGAGVAAKPVAELGGGSAASRPLLGGDSAAPAALPTVVYFDFDSFALLDEAKGIVGDYAKLMGADTSKQFMLEGHTDERGGREYNLALGQKRAESVVRAMAALGVADSRLEAVSFGEERPAIQGGGEQAWSKNRRVEFKPR